LKKKGINNKKVEKTMSGRGEENVRESVRENVRESVRENV